MQAVATDTELPAQFLDLEAFQSWVRAGFGEDATTVLKGRRWRNFLCELIPLTDLGRQYPVLIPSQKESDDGGVDAQSDPADDGRFLVLQSRLDVSDKIHLDSVLSAFQSFEAQ